ncbi:MAG TPA: bifunctional DNA-binding transcriptional regulator/O6-methylguanine-DNA methyltransferase Ada [Verrucomicrobiae bacterium]|nr:bifunctional DNA-binding transcriptional regulator/O6-methylguanine-DNA methyltransferase Ada [Verrucomicrobiae bacterium]
MLNHDECWAAVCRRDRTFDGRFYTGVLTTGVYCRPSCSARRALRKNVRFYPTARAAEADGLRACKRCRPADTAQATAPERIAAVCRLIDRNPAEGTSLEALAERAGMSRFHFARTFKAVVGVTPKAYAAGARLRQLKGGLRANDGIEAALYDAGYGSPSRIYELADTRLGMTPAQYRRAGAGVAISHATLETALGLVTIGATDRGLCFVQFGDSREELLRRLHDEYPNARVEPMREPVDPQFERWCAALREHLEGVRPHDALPVDVRATAFQLAVWRYLQSIPSGEVRSYREVAEGIGRPGAARAVARACAGNAVALAIPCHRVIRGNGELGGYRWGLERKRALLDAERSARAISRAR